MRLSAILLLSPIAAFATPIASAPVNETDNSVLLARDNRCWLHSEALPAQGCDTTPYSGERKETFTGASRFTVSCTAAGKPWPGPGGETKRDYVPAYNCWIWSGWTQIGCEAGIRHDEYWIHCL